jgi:hypothetical protein
MSRKLVSVRTIDALRPIPGADAIEVATIGGWELVVKRGEFEVGVPCLYFEIDSFLPKHVPAFSFLMTRGLRTFEGVEGHKLKTIRLRGQRSQGLALPLTMFAFMEPLLRGVQTTDEELANYWLPAEKIPMWREYFFGMHEYEAALAPQDFDWAPMFDVVKWEVELPASLKGQAKGTFPSFIRKTDQERCQNMKQEIFGSPDETYVFDVSTLPQEAIDAMLQKGHLQVINGIYHRIVSGLAGQDPDTVYEVTLKVDGSSFTAYVKADDDGNVVTGVCSRNLELKVNDENKDNAFVKMFVESGLQAAMIEMYNNPNNHIPDGRPFAFAVQGELMGPGIQSNREGFTENKLFVFDIFDINQGFYMPPMFRHDVVEELQKLGAKLEHVPILDACAKLSDLGLHDIASILAFANGPSINNPVREGVVFKRMDGQFSFKAISNLYLEMEKD